MPVSSDQLADGTKVLNNQTNMKIVIFELCWHAIKNSQADVRDVRLAVSWQLYKHT